MREFYQGDWKAVGSYASVIIVYYYFSEPSIRVLGPLIKIQAWVCFRQDATIPAQRLTTTWSFCSLKDNMKINILFI